MGGSYAAADAVITSYSIHYTKLYDVLGLTRGLAVEWANDNITVNSIAPGWYPSEMSRQVMDEKRKAQILGRMPVHRFGDTSYNFV